MINSQGSTSWLRRLPRQFSPQTEYCRSQYSNLYNSEPDNKILPTRIVALDFDAVLFGRYPTSITVTVSLL